MERGRQTQEGEGRANLNKVKMHRELQGHAASLNTEQNTTTPNTRKQPPTSYDGYRGERGRDREGGKRQEDRGGTLFYQVR